MAQYAELPTGAKLDFKPFKAHVDESKLQHFKKLLELSPIAPAVFENTHAGRKYGTERDWLDNAKQVWLNEFDWRKHEDRMNSFPNFIVSVEDTKGNSLDIHFLALFSKRTDAVPITLLHGWPSSNYEFLDILDMLRDKYSPEDLPYHIIVPSLPGYAYSSDLPLQTNFTIEMAAEAINNLMIGLGFGSGYLTHGGDLGSFVSRVLAMQYDACKGMHVNMMIMPPLQNSSEAEMTELEKRAIQKAKEFVDTDYAFALEQGTRPATVGLALSASPLALLCWIGEKLLAWSEEDPPLEKILEVVTLYWMTDTITRCFYHNRQLAGAGEKPPMARISVITQQTAFKLPCVEKPSGYSFFAHEIVPIPKSWAAQTCNLVSFAYHEHGGHFAAMEQPKELLFDIEEYIKTAWKCNDKE